MLPLSRACVASLDGSGSRVYPRCHTLSATGRVNLSEPSLQCIPKPVTLSVMQPLPPHTTPAMASIVVSVHGFFAVGHFAVKKISFG